jgi:hypothetical protein
LFLVLPFAEKFVVEEASGDILFPRSLAAAGTSTYIRKSSGFYLAVVEPVMRNQNRLEELTD